MAHASDPTARGQPGLKRRRVASFESVIQTVEPLNDATEQSIRRPSISSTIVGRSPERLLTPGPYQRDSITVSQSPAPRFYLDEPDDNNSGWSNGSRKPYQYQELLKTDIRLLRLSQGETNDQIKCALQHVHLDFITRPEPRNFQALSYAWGQGSNADVIYLYDLPRKDSATVDGDAMYDEESLRSLPVRTNLFHALKSIRSTERDEWVWVDAICIDQANNVEKSHQIPKMPDIYSSAGNVVIWLGEEVYQNFSFQMIQLLFPNILNLKQLDKLLKEGKMKHRMSQSLLAFCELLKRPWFSRRWVIQEVACARNLSVRFGTQVHSWVDFSDAIELLLDNLERLRQICMPPEGSDHTEHPVLRDIDSVGLRSLLQLSRNVFRKSNNAKIISRLLDLESLVVAASSFQVSEPQDIIYALQFLGNDTNTIYPDYGKDPISVFSDFVQRCMQTHKSLDIILQPWLNCRKQKIITPPTWMNQRNLAHTRMESLSGTPRSRIYNASGEVDMKATLLTEASEMDDDDDDDDDAAALLTANTSLATPKTSSRLYTGILQANGVVLGTIQRIHKPNASTNAITIPQDCLHLLGWDGKWDSISDRVWRTLVANRTHDHRLAPSWYRRACAAALREIEEDGDFNLSAMMADETQPQTVMQYINRILSVIKGRIFFSCQATKTSGEEVVGLAPINAHPKDLICILFGCSVPVVLRPNKDGKTHKLVGECYVHDHMEGAIFSGRKQQRIEEMTRTFKIT